MVIAHGAGVSSADAELVERIGRGEEDAFEQLVDAHGASLLHVAVRITTSRAVAEEVVQETWVAFLQGLGRFEGRSSLRTWLFGILLNSARKSARRERRSLPLSDVGPDEDEVDPSRFMPAGRRWAGHWRLDDFTAWPRSWSDLPESRLLGKELRKEIGKALEPLPAAQRLVFTLRDVEGLSADEVCGLLDLTGANQRVLLHRARSKVRGHVERYLEEHHD